MNAFAEFGLESFNHFNVNCLGTNVNLDNLDELMFEVGVTYRFDIGQLKRSSRVID